MAEDDSASRERSLPRGHLAENVMRDTLLLISRNRTGTVYEKMSLRCCSKQDIKGSIAKKSGKLEHYAETKRTMTV